MQPRTAFLVAAFAATVPAANWMMGHVGTACADDAPCLVPVGFGLMAPSGVLMIGAALVLRDMVQEAGGTGAAIVAIVVGGAVAWLVAPPMLVVASVAAFLIAELADLAVYTPLRRRRPGVAVLASGAVGSLADSLVFLWIAFASVDHLAGQMLGKMWVSLLAAPVIARLRKPAASSRGPACSTETPVANP